MPRRDEQGKILNWYGVGTDIEDRKRAEEAARRRESELRELIEAIPAVTWSAGPGGSRTFISKNWTELTGLSPENALGFGWLTAVHPEDAERHLSRWQEAIEAGVPFGGRCGFDTRMEIIAGYWLVPFRCPNRTLGRIPWINGDQAASHILL